MSLIQELMSQSAASGGALSANLIKRFSPAEIRESIQQLVATEQIEMAVALGDAGLSLYPHSEDILAITGLLAMINQDWQLAIELIDELIELQGDSTPAFTFVMMVRALRCNLEPQHAYEVAQRGLSLYPSHLELIAEKLALDEFAGSVVNTGGKQQ